MKLKSCVLLALAVAFVVFSSAQQPLFGAPKDGPGPLCWPGDPCIIKSVLSAPKGGPGPMCFPGDPCFPSGSVVNVAMNAPRGGPGPVCYPGVGCGDQ